MRNAQSECVRRIPLLMLCLVPWVAPLPGATLQRLSLDDLIQKSSGIVRAKVVGSYTDFRGAAIYTHWKLQIVESWKGGGQSTAEVMVPGGSARGFHQSVPGAPQLAAGKEYLLFLWTSKSGSIYLTGWGQGVFNLTRSSGGDLVASRAAGGETMLDPGTWQPVKNEGLEMRYADLTARISGALKPTIKQGAGQ
jgi:hypothetical protein